MPRMRTPAAPQFVWPPNNPRTGLGTPCAVERTIAAVSSVVPDDWGAAASNVYVGLVQSKKADPAMRISQPWSLSRYYRLFQPNQ